MTAGWPIWWVPGALWSRESRAHLRWTLRRSKADAADRRGLMFQYVHPIAGPFVYHPADYLSRRIFLYDDFERAELQFAVEHARRGGTIVDVGANIGLYTAACAAAAGAHGRVVALEPGPGTFAKLMATCRHLGLENVSALQVAADRLNGTARLVCDPKRNDVHQHLADARMDDHAIDVETRRIDDVTDPSAVTLLKIDVEGHEVQALEGAAAVLANGRAHLIVEFFPAGLAAAGASAAGRWRLLCRTHRCTAVVRFDGSTPPPEAHPAAAANDESWNTLWAPC